MTLLVDAGPLYAAARTDDPAHAVCADLLEAHRDQLLAPQLVLAEVCYLLGSRHGPQVEARFVGSLATGELLSEPVRPADWLRVTELLVQYRDLRLGTVDASVVAAAERLGVTTIATLDRRDFGAVRPRHAPAFTLLP